MFTPTPITPLSLLRPLVAAVWFSLTLHACGLTSSPPPPSATRPTGFMPIDRATTATPGTRRDPLVIIGDPPDPIGAHLSYLGGRVISNVRVVQVLYGAGSYLPQLTNAAAPSMATFFQQITNSAQFDFLAQYNTPSQQIGRGSYVGQVQITPARNGAQLTQQDIQAEIRDQILSGALPAPTVDAAGNTNTYYAVFFPHGTSIITPFGPSCVPRIGFCGYHDTIADVAGREVYFGVHPDVQAGSGCEICGSESPFATAQMVASHELVEAVTDPEIGLVPSLPARAPLAWYDVFYNQEIADLCNGIPGSFVGADGQTYAVQQEFSNATGECLTSAAGGTPPPPPPPPPPVIFLPPGAPPTEPEQVLFGGMFQVDDCGTNTIANPFTGQPSCPSGYTSILFGRVLGPESRCGVNQSYCGALVGTAPQAPPHTWAFAGRYQVDDCGRNNVGNPWVAGGLGCPYGAQALLVGRTKAPESGCGANQYMCGFADGSPTARTMPFGGAYQLGDCGTNTYSNPFTFNTTCPPGWIPVSAGRVKVPEGSQCGGSQYFCAAPADVPCFNGVKDQHETDIDCGGNSCRACGLGRTCLADSDCASGQCTNGVCTRVNTCDPGARATGPLGARQICP